MTTTFAPFGIRPIKDPSWRGRVERFENALVSGYAQNIYKGAAVKLDGTGHFEIVTSPADEIFGIVNGFAWRDPLGNERTAPNWTAGTIASAIRIELYCDPGTVFEVQTDGVVGQEALGQMLAMSGFVNGSPRDGNSTAYASASILSSGGQLAVINVSNIVGNAWGDNYPILHVRVPSLGANLAGVSGGGGSGGPPLSSVVPQAVGTSGQIGTSPQAARADHVHAHGDLLGGSLHALASPSSAGFMSAAQSVKVDGMADGATNTPLAIATPLPIGPAAVGTSIRAAREDHVHQLSASGVTPGAYTLANVTFNSFGIATLASSTAISGPNSVVFRGADSKIAVADLPAFLINNVFEASSQSAMLALAASQGDIALRTDESKSYVLAAPPASTLANWKELLFPPIPGAVTSVFGLPGPSVTIPGLLSLGGGMDPMDEFPVYDASTNTHRRVPFSVLSANFLTTSYVPPLATAVSNGTITAADFTKLQGLQNTPLATTAALSVGTANTIGVGTTAARADHVHAHGDQGGGSLHAIATTSTAGFMSPSMVTALNASTPNAIVTITAVANAGAAVAGPDAQNRTVAIAAGNMAAESGQLAAANAGFVLYDVTTGLPIKVTANGLLPALVARTTAAEADIVATSTAAGALGKTTIAQLFTDRTLVRPTFTGAVETKQARTDISGSGTLPPFTGQNTYHYRLTGNATLTLPTAPTAANSFLGITVIIEQDGTGGRTCAFAAPSGDVIKWDGGTVPTMATAAAARTKIVFTKAQGETRWDGSVVFKDA